MEYDKTTKKCIEDCSKCYEECIKTIAHCLKMGGEHASSEHIGVLMDCAEACKISQNLMLRMSPNSAEFCEECAEVCDKCAESCDAIGKEDAQMKECAKICRECAASCREMEAAQD